jgi:DNA-directed RNA polymerase subunit E'/Rpb7
MTTRMNKFDKYKDNVIYSDCLITRTIQLSITSIDKDIYKTILQKIVDEYEGRCVVEGFIKPSSCNIMSYSSGLIKSDYIIYEVVFNCKICFPVEGMIIRCIANNITKAGIRAEIAHVKPSPAVVFITRDHHYNVDFFSTIKEGDMFEASVIGQRFELNDKFVSIIAKLKEPKKHESKINAPVIVDSSEELKSKKTKTKKPKTVIEKKKKPTLQPDEDEDMMVIVPQTLKEEKSIQIANDDEEEKSEKIANEEEEEEEKSIKIANDEEKEDNIQEKKSQPTIQFDSDDEDNPTEYNPPQEDEDDDDMMVLVPKMTED